MQLCGLEKSSAGTPVPQRCAEKNPDSQGGVDEEGGEVGKKRKDEACPQKRKKKERKMSHSDKIHPKKSVNTLRVSESQVAA